MLPDLGRYAGTVLTAYGATALPIGLLVAVTWLRATRVRRRLAETEARVSRGRP